ncbi:MAG: MmgE/PrpD family protein, partial [Gammaproteobacteria bacterium]|nr:MmgE/PrpD family protein [Gammaproteobacteria bacterium]MBU1443154.1 MmgE/PrpD family protein [Gammaproteobacteria bacterium]
MSPPALALAEFAATLRHGDLPPAVREAAVRSLVDTIGVAIKGQQHPVAAMALDAAERLYRKALDAQAGNADALHYLGVVQHQRGRHDEAVRTIERAV